MKWFVFVLTLGFLAAEPARAQEHQLICKADSCSMTAIDDNLKRLHLLGNEFERQVAERLQNGRLQVVSPKVSLKSWRSEGTGYFQISYTVLLRPANGKPVARHFARLGTMKGGTSLAAAKKAVALENAPKIGRLKKLYGTQPVCSGDYTNNAGVFWYIEDCFAVGH